MVGYTGGAGSREISLQLNNLPERTVAAKDNVFHFKTPLSLAMNLIEIKGQETGGAQSQSLVIFREIRMSSELSSDLPEYKFHRDEDKKPCVKCYKLKTRADIKAIAKVRRIANGRTQYDKRQKRGPLLKSARKLVSRGFDKTLRKLFDGSVVKRRATKTNLLSTG